MPAPAPDEVQAAGLREVCRGAAIAAKAAEPVLVTNGVGIVWNTCLSWVRRARWSAIREFLVDAFAALDGLPQGQADASVVGPLAVALLRCLLEIGSNGPSEDLSAKTRAPKPSVSAADVKLAEDVLRLAMSAPLAPVPRKEVAAMMAKLGAAKAGGPPSSATQIAVPVGRQPDEKSLAVAMAELLSFETVESKRRELFHKVSVLASSATNCTADDVSLFGRLAVEAVELKEYDPAFRLASQGISLAANTVTGDRSSRDQLRWLAVCRYAIGKALIRDT
jgi:hypothetical protein